MHHFDQSIEFFILIEIAFIVSVDGKEMLIPGENAHVRLTTFRKMVMKVGQNFTIREGKTTLLTGMITKEHPNVDLTHQKLSDVVFKE